jgi:RNA polymerase sigma-70 factor (ECF subfamily)
MFAIQLSPAEVFDRLSAPQRVDDDVRARERAKERELVTRFREGDVQAFATLVAAHMSRLTRFATYLLGSPDAAEDCVQGVLVDLWDHRDRVEVGRPLRPYLLRAIQNRVHNERRAETVRTKYQRTETAANVGHVPNPEEAILTSAMVQDALRQLPDRRQLALRLRLEQGLNDLEISEFLQISLPATDRLLRRALAELRDILVVSKK